MCLTIACALGKACPVFTPCCIFTEYNKAAIFKLFETSFKGKKKKQEKGKKNPYFDMPEKLTAK